MSARHNTQDGVLGEDVPDVSAVGVEQPGLPESTIECPRDNSGPPIMFPPSGVYFDGPTGKFLVDSGTYFRTYGRKSPIINGVIRHFISQGLSEKDASDQAARSVADAEIDRHVEWSGSLAGYRKGLIHSCDGKPMLVTTSPTIPVSISGHAPIISGLIRQAFPDQVQHDVFIAWLAGLLRAVRAGVHHPAPMLCLAGKPNTGKSLLAFIVKMIAGGRSANPHNAWTGSLPWNDDLCAAEVLLLDDCQGSTDIRSRMNFASNFKAAIYADDVQMRKRHCSALSVRPVWRVMVCCNDTAESLLILPPIGPDMSDKVILLKIEPINMPIDTSTTEGRQQLQRMIMEELPMLAAYLDTFVIPEELRDSRSGVIAWRHPDLVHAIESHKPEGRLEELLMMAFSNYLWNDLPSTMTAAEVEARLIDRDSPVREQAKALFAGWQAACGTYLGRLADNGSGIIQPAEYDAHMKRRRFHVRKP